MPVLETVCLTCGVELNAKSECLACLLRVGLPTATNLDSTESMPRIFGDFQIACHEDGSLWELGRGAMGVTYRAIDNVLHRAVALKVIETPCEMAKSPVVRERFLCEARSAAALHHPNVAEVFQLGTTPEMNRAYYAMELIDGETLEERVRRDGPLRVDPALQIAVQVTHALEAAAAHHLVHRDLKPGNIMLSPADQALNERVTVIDFGLAKTVAGVAHPMNLTHGGFVGTPMFASPEQFSGEAADARSDIYSLGATLWYALTGEVPFAGRSIEEIRRCQSETPLPLYQLTARKIPGCVVALLRRALAIDPAGRPPSAMMMLVELARCQRSAARAKRRGQLRTRVMAIGCVCACLATITSTRLLNGTYRHPPIEPRDITKTTTSAPAYLAYLRGVTRLSHEGRGSPAALHQSETDFREAVQLDPSFAAAWAQLSIVHSSLYFDHEELGLTAAKQALDAVARLAPGSGEFFLAEGYYHYHGQHQFDEAVRDFTQATLRLPNHADAFLALGYVQRRLDRWEDSLASFTQAERIDPLNPAHLAALSNTYLVLGRYQEARAISDRSIAIAPDAPKSFIFKAMIYQWEGDVASAARLLDAVPLQPIDTPSRLIQIRQWFYERRYDRAIAASRDALQAAVPPTENQRLDILIDLGQAQKFSGDLTAASATLHEARKMLARKQPAEMDAGGDWTRLAWIDALLGDRALALQESEKSVSQVQIDPLEAARNETAFAQVCVQIGEADRAIAPLPRLVRTPGSEITAGLLRIDPIWDPIRKDPRFEKLANSTTPIQL